MNIVVPIKQTFTTEARIALEDGKVSDKGIKQVVNPYDEFAVERAITSPDLDVGIAARDVRVALLVERDRA